MRTHAHTHTRTHAHTHTCTHEKLCSNIIHSNFNTTIHLCTMQITFYKLILYLLSLMIFNTRNYVSTEFSMFTHSTKHKRTWIIIIIIHIHICIHRLEYEHHFHLGWMYFIICHHIVQVNDVGLGLETSVTYACSMLYRAKNTFPISYCAKQRSIQSITITQSFQIIVTYMQLISLARAKLQLAMCAQTRCTC